MNLNGIVSMVMRQLTRRAVNFGVTKGMSMMTRVGKKGDNSAQVAPQDMTPEERAAQGAQTQQAQQAAKRARQVARITRRLGR